MGLSKVVLSGRCFSLSPDFQEWHSTILAVDLSGSYKLKQIERELHGEQFQNFEYVHNFNDFYQVSITVMF